MAAPLQPASEQRTAEAALFVMRAAIGAPDRAEEFYEVGDDSGRALTREQAVAFLVSKRKPIMCDVRLRAGALSVRCEELVAKEDIGEARREAVEYLDLLRRTVNRATGMSVLVRDRNTGYLLSIGEFEHLLTDYHFLRPLTSLFGLADGAAQALGAGWVYEVHKYPNEEGGGGAGRQQPVPR